MSDQIVPGKISKTQVNKIFGGNSQPTPIKTGNYLDVRGHRVSSVDHSAVDKWSNAISSFDTSGLVKLMIDEVSKIPYKKKRELGVVNDHDAVEKILSLMSDLLSNNFLRIDFKTSHSREVNNSDWSKVTSCRRSDSGTTGIYFIQCVATGPPPNLGRSPSRTRSPASPSQSSEPSDYTEIIVAKPVSKEDFEKQLFVNEIAKEFFKINCPAIRFISKSDSEFKVLESAVKQLFLPFHEEMYTAGGQGSPKALFESHAIMLMELVKGKPLCHRTEGQRLLRDEDFRAVGRMFLLDLLIRNTDRLPCRKALPRPGSVLISDHGNAGNLMFGENAGSLYTIDPEMQTSIDSTREADYQKSLESVFIEIYNDEINMPRYKALEGLFFNALPGLSGVLDVSLEEFTPWSSATPLQHEAIASILAMIRIRAKAEDGFIIQRANGLSPPESTIEREWREWIRHAAPRATIDVLKFIEVYTGYKCPPTAASKFQQGFLEAMAGALQFQKEIQSPFGTIAMKRQQLFRILLESNQLDVGFIRRMIEGLSNICPSLPFPAPADTCDEENKPGRLGSTKKKFMSAVERVMTPKASSLSSDLTSATSTFLASLVSEETEVAPLRPPSSTLSANTSNISNSSEK